jgi:hypothetical protein
VCHHMTVISFIFIYLSFTIVIINFFAVLGIEPRASHKLRQVFYRDTLQTHSSLYFYFILFFEIGSHYVGQAGLELAMYEPPHLAVIVF